MKKYIISIIVASLLCGLLFTCAAAENVSLDSLMIQIGGTDDVMIEHSVYSDLDTMYSVAATLGWPIRSLPKNWQGYSIEGIMLSFSTYDNPPQIDRPSREPDRIEMGSEQAFYLWDESVRPYIEKIGIVHVFYVNLMDERFAVTIGPREWEPSSDEEPNGFYFTKADPVQGYMAYDQANCVQSGGNEKTQFLCYSSQANMDVLSEEEFQLFLCSLPTP